jgi:formylglycine-generating enzyme required for sulfatase activity
VKVVPVPPLARDLHVIDKPIRLELIHIPSGEFLMGDDKQRIEVAEFYISRYPITNAQFAKFVQAKKYERPSHWGAGGIPAGKENHPVVYVSWHNTVAFCDWLSEATGRRFRLPTEAEWEKAARGGLRIPQKVFTLSATAAWRKMLSTDLRIPSYGDALRDNPLPGRQYPWGNEIDKNKCNTYESGIRDTTPVGKYSPAGDSPYGVADMAGNVWEWTQEIVLRGGSSRNVHGDAAAPVRRSGTPDSRSDVFGFRVCAVLLPP